MVAGQGATATVWTPDLLQTLAQTRQVTVFTNRGLGFSQDAAETQNGTVAGNDYCMQLLFCCHEALGTASLFSFSMACWPILAMRMSNV